MSTRFLIRGGYVFFPEEEAMRRADVEIAEGRIARIAQTLPAEADTRIIGIWPGGQRLALRSFITDGPCTS